MAHYGSDSKEVEELARTLEKKLGTPSETLRQWLRDTLAAAFNNLGAR
jgi:hypothetical protein